jgi:putative SOS response-associated peptidase YedK
MCGRVRLRTDFSQIRIKLKFDAAAAAPNVPASWNVCPTDPMLVAVREDEKRIPQQMRWGLGLVPWWAKDIKVGFASINARAESVDKTPAFRDAWKKGERCLVITDGFYEWKKPEKQPYAIGMADDDLLVMAGLWDEWKSPKGEHIKSCTIITCPPNKVAGALHDRMPVVLSPDTWSRWLGEQSATPVELKSLLVPCPDEALKIWLVDRAKIGNVRNKSRDIADPVVLSA